MQGHRLERKLKANKWNYRIFKREYRYRRRSKAHTVYELHETYYDDAGKPDGWSTDPQAGPAESVEELIEDLRMMARDAYKSRKDILDYEKM